VRRTSDKRIVDTVHDVALDLARQGVRSLDARTGRLKLADRLEEMLSRDDKVLVDASSVAFVPKGAVFATSVKECKFPNVIAALARRGLVLTDDAIGVLKDHPHLWHDLMNVALDPFRPFIPRDEDAREKLRDLGDAAIPKTGRSGGSLVKFNVAAPFRTAEAVAADLHATRSVEINR